MAHTGGPGDIPQRVHCTNFLSGRAIRHMMTYTVHMSVPTHIAACFCTSLWCLRSSPSVLRWKSIRRCSSLLAPLSGITLTIRATHSLHYTLSNSLHDDTVSTSVHPVVSTQETNGTASSGSLSSPQLPHSLISSQVPAGPTRNVTGEVMPPSLAEAVTQLSFLEFLQRCNLLIAPPQPPQLPVPISLLDAAVQTTPPVMPLRMCLRRRLISQSPRYLFTWQCRRLSIASTSHLWMLLCRFHAVILQEASDHVQHISEQFLVCTSNTDLAILLNKDTFEPDPVVLTYKVDSTSKGTWGMV